jgi:hypothetical protein
MIGSSVLVAPLVALALAVATSLVFAITESVLAARSRRQLAGLGDDAMIRRAAQGVIAARAELARVVAEPEESRAGESQPGPGLRGETGSIGWGTTLAESREKLAPTGDRSGADRDLVDRRAAAREAVIDAQRLWEAVRPSIDTTSRLWVWSGRGWLRAWQLGPIGFERVMVRCDHLADPGCWVISEFRRVRFGFGFGAESLRLAVFAAGTPSRRLVPLITKMLDGPEAALRPGFAPLRWWYRRGRSPIATAATDAVLEDRPLDHAPQPSTTAALRAALIEEFGPSYESSGLAGIEQPTAVVHTAGPSALIGVWWGGAPVHRICSASSHIVWREAS